MLSQIYYLSDFNYIKKKTVQYFRDLFNLYYSGMDLYIYIYI